MLATLSRLYDEGKIAEVKTILSRSLRYSLMLVIPSVFGVSVLSKPLVLLFTTAEFADASPAIVPLIASAAAVFGIASITVYSLQLTKKTKLVATTWLIAALANVGLNLVLIPRLGIVGAAIATLLSFTFTSIAVNYLSFKSLPIIIDWFFILKSLIASAVMAAVIWLVAPYGLIATVLWIITGAAIYFCVLFLLRGLTVEEIKSLWGLFNRAMLPRISGNR